MKGGISLELKSLTPKDTFPQQFYVQLIKTSKVLKVQYPQMNHNFHLQFERLITMTHFPSEQEKKPITID